MTPLVRDLPDSFSHQCTVLLCLLSSLSRCSQILSLSPTFLFVAGVGLLFQSDPNKEMIVASPPVGGSSAYKAGMHHRLQTRLPIP